MAKQFTPAEQAELDRIDAELKSIEAIEYDECPPALYARHEELCKQRWAIDPPLSLFNKIG